MLHRGMTILSQVCLPKDVRKEGKFLTAAGDQGCNLLTQNISNVSSFVLTAMEVKLRVKPFRLFKTSKLFYGVYRSSSLKIIFPSTFNINLLTLRANSNGKHVVPSWFENLFCDTFRNVHIPSSSTFRNMLQVTFSIRTVVLIIKILRQFILQIYIYTHIFGI